MKLVNIPHKFLRKERLIKQYGCANNKTYKGYNLRLKLGMDDDDTVILFSINGGEYLIQKSYDSGMFLVKEFLNRKPKLFHKKQNEDSECAS